ncbi:MAG: glutaminyl-peptide cyclotransferase [Rhodothermales bacterium]
MLIVAGTIVYLSLPRTPQKPVPVFRPQALAKYPHDTTAFTQGLLIEGGKLYESTGHYGKSLVRRVDLKTGDTEQAHSLGKTFFGEGLAALNGRLYQLTWKERSAFVYDLQSLTPLDTLPIPTQEGWGLTEDGEHLILSDGTDRLHFLDPQSLEILREVEVRDGNRSVSKLNELEYINGLVYANVWQDSHIAIINPDDGTVVGWLNLAWLNVVHAPVDGADVLNGIAYDPASKRLYITGKLWPAIYAFALPDLEG